MTASNVGNVVPSSPSKCNSGTATLEIEWEETFPQSSSGRVGHSDRELYFVGYWFPKVAVYDDLRGWGQPSFPDRTLMYVRGFDQASQRFIYEINERFDEADIIAHENANKTGGVFALSAGAKARRAA